MGLHNIKLFALVTTLLLCTFVGFSQSRNVDFMKVASSIMKKDAIARVLIY